MSGDLSAEKLQEREPTQSVDSASLRKHPRPVRVLDDKTVNQIAAGEVVERPSSVVKELVENSIDAGATAITVSIANGGRSLIEVRDDGCGMSRHDALVAIERFGTSKIANVEDLFSVATHGFRGEAIPSIAAVSRFTLTTCVQGEQRGTEIRIDGGKLGEVAEKGLSGGTTIQVRNLFFNVPARRAFLRSERTEEGQIRALLVDFAAAYPEVRFRLLCDGEEALLFPAEKGFFERVHTLRLGGGLRIEEVLRAPEGEYRVRGVVSRPLEAVAGSGRLRLIVNGRSVRDRVLLRAVKNGYGNFLKGDKYPSGVVSLEVPPTEVDVNVHPQKTEIRFRAPDRIFSLLHRAVSAALARAEILTPAESFAPPQRSFPPVALNAFERGPISFHPAPARDPLRASAGGEGGPSSRIEDGEEVGYGVPADFAPATQQSFLLRSQERSELGADSPESEDDASGADDFGSPSPFREPSSGASHSAFRPQEMRYLGQIFRCYLLFEQHEQLIIVDMHAAHERVRFYQLKRQFLSGGIAEQLLALPEVVELPPDQRERFVACESELRRFGIQCELFGEHQIVVRSVPAILKGVSPRQLILDLLSLDESQSWSGAVERAFDSVIARMACHSSVRGGQELSREEAYALLDLLLEAERSAFCPHGRPVVSAMSKYEMELRFGRKE